MNKFCIVANVKQDSALRIGAKVYILNWHGNFDSVRVRGLSKGGRVITKYIAIPHLENYRAQWIPPRMNINKDCYKYWSDNQAAKKVANNFNMYSEAGNYNDYIQALNKERDNANT